MPREVEIARRAVACKNWRWMPGMIALWGEPFFRLLCDVAPLDDLDEYATEAEALVAALEMANERQAAP